MPTINSNDTFLVQRGSNTYKLNAEDLMSTILDTDYLLINRGSDSYKVTGADVKDQLGGPDGTTSAITSVTSKVAPLYSCNDPNTATGFYNYGSPPRFNTSNNFPSSFTAPQTNPTNNWAQPCIVPPLTEDSFADYPISGSVTFFMAPWKTAMAGQYAAFDMKLTITDVNGSTTHQFAGTNGSYSTYTATGLVNATKIKYEYGNQYGSISGFHYANMGMQVNGMQLVWGEERQNVTVEDASGFSAGDCVSAFGGTSAGSGKIMSIYNNTLNLYDVFGTITSSGTIAKMGGASAMPPSNIRPANSPLQPGYNPSNPIVYP